jgi:hypothetical protein
MSIDTAWSYNRAKFLVVSCYSSTHSWIVSTQIVFVDAFTGLFSRRHRHFRLRIIIRKLAPQISSADDSGNNDSQCSSVLHLGRGLNPFTGSLGEFWHTVALVASIVCPHNKTSCSSELVDTDVMCVMTSFVITVMRDVEKFLFESRQSSRTFCVIAISRRNPIRNK